MPIRKVQNGKTYVEMYVDAASVYAVDEMLESCNSRTDSFEIVFQSRIRDWCDYDAGYEYRYVDAERTESGDGEIGWVLTADVIRRTYVKSRVFSRDCLERVAMHAGRSGGYIDCVDYLLRRDGMKAITYKYVNFDPDKVDFFCSLDTPYIRCLYVPL